MPNIGPMMMGKTPPDWRVFLEGSKAPSGNVCWSIDPAMANLLTETTAKAMADSLHAFLLTIVKNRGGR
jgi:hypothetical protein